MPAPHILSEFRSDFLKPGYTAVCSCGWESEIAESYRSAQTLHAEHHRDANRALESERKQ